MVSRKANGRHLSRNSRQRLVFLRDDGELSSDMSESAHAASKALEHGLIGLV